MGLAKKSVSNEEYNAACKNIDNCKIMHSVTDKYRSSLDKDDLSECRDIGLWRALQYYNPNHPKNQKFTTYLYNFVQWECLRKLNERKPEETTTSSFDHIPSGEQPLDRLMLMDCLETLPTEEKDLLKYKFFDNMTLDEMAQKQHRSKETVRKRLQQAVSNLKSKLLQGEEECLPQRQ